MTPQQEQARAVADASFESNAKAPEKRQEIALADVNSDMEDSSLDKGDDAEQNPLDNLSVASVTSHPSSLTSTALSDEASYQKIETAESTNTQISSKAASTHKNRGNGNGSAPKNKNGSLDPNRLPDSSGDHNGNAKDSHKD